MKIRKRARASCFPPDKGGSRGVKHIPYERRLTDIAREHRANPTAAEKKLWQALSHRQQQGLKFTRQKPLDRFIADFYCSELKLVIEVDGDSHTGQREYDRLRSEVLRTKYGIATIRYHNTDILANITGVLTDLRRRIEYFQTNPLSPPCQGEGKKRF